MAQEKKEENKNTLEKIVKSPIKILGISGSLRKASTNSGVLRFISKNLPKNVEFEIADISELPLFNQDIENADEKKNPLSVQAFREQIRKSDAILFASSEYNYSISGVLKNAIDWGSRSAQYGNAFVNKTATVIGCGGGLGTGRAQYHLRQVAVFVELQFLTKPELMIRVYESEITDKSGDIIDKKTQDRIIAQVEALRNFTYKHKLGEAAFAELVNNKL